MKTAVEWLDEQLQDKMYFVYGYTDGVRKVTIPLEDYMKFKQEALELEKEQIKDAYANAVMKENNSDYIGMHEQSSGEIYFAETYGSKGSDATSSQTENKGLDWLVSHWKKLKSEGEKMNWEQIIQITELAKYVPSSQTEISDSTITDQIDGIIFELPFDDKIKLWELIDKLVEENRTEISDEEIEAQALTFAEEESYGEFSGDLWKGYLFGAKRMRDQLKSRL